MPLYKLFALSFYQTLPQAAQAAHYHANALLLLLLRRTSAHPRCFLRAAKHHTECCPRIPTVDGDAENHKGRLCES